MTWNDQATISTPWTSQSNQTDTWNDAALIQSPYRSVNQSVVTYAGDGSFNVTGRLFNQIGILFNHKVPIGSHDIIWDKQTNNQTTWRIQE